MMGLHVTLCWIKGHNDNPGNEMADANAKLGTTSDRYQAIPAPLQVAKQAIHDQCVTFWQEEWDMVPGHRQTKIFIGEVSTKIYKRMTAFLRPKLSQMVGWMTGHCLLNRHLHIMGLVRTNLCRTCQGSLETPGHILLECPRFEALRYQLLAEQNRRYDYPDRGPLARIHGGWVIEDRKVTDDILDIFEKVIDAWTCTTSS